MATRRKTAKTRNPKRKRGSRPTNVTTREQRIATLRWSRNDAHEALTAALSMGDWAGVVKYAKQVQGFESKLLNAETARTGVRRFDRAGSTYHLSPDEQKRGIRFATAGRKFGRGRLP